jgi:tetratricopeptide (TPR) repeat protein
MSAPSPPFRQPAASGAVARHLAEAGRLRAAGRLVESIAPMMQAARLDPGNAVIFHDLGLTFLEVGRTDDAATALRRSVALRPDFAQAHWRLAATLDKMEDTAGAITAYETATRLQPSLGEAHYRVGVLLELEGRLLAALDHFRKASTSGKGRQLRRLAEARALMIEDRDAEARALLRRSLATEPNHVATLALLGIMLTEIGEFAEGATYLERALGEAPTMAGLYYDLARCRRIQRGFPLIANMEAARAIEGVRSIARTHLELALGKAYDDLGDYQAAMAAFDAAYELRKSTVLFDLGVFESQVERVIQMFTPELVTRAREIGDTDRTPILILGMPRSGTTLCEQIVSSHPQVVGGGELSFWNDHGPEVDEAGPTSAFVAKTGQEYLALLRRIGPGAARVTDKKPFNFIWAGLIHMAFPSGVIIHMRRSPIDTALSIHQTYFSPSSRFPTGGEDLVRYYRAYERIMEHWRVVLPPGRFVEIDYEALTADPEPNIRRLIAATGLDWDDACLHPERNNRVVKTPSKWQAKQPINRSSVNRWRRYEPYLGPLAALIN